MHLLLDRPIKVAKESNLAPKGSPGHEAGQQATRLATPTRLMRPTARADGKATQFKT